MPASLFTAAHQELVSRVIKMRKGAGLTQRQLANAVGREQNFIARIETGQRRVDLIEFVTICQACRTNPEEAVIQLVRAIGTLLPRRRK